jgi:hypothetical protein
MRYDPTASTVPFWPDYAVDVPSVEAALVDFPHGDHVPKFSRQLDRLVYESIPAGQQEVIAAHVVWDMCPRHLRPEIIARKAGCTTKVAVHLADALSILDSDERLAREICRWARIRGAEATLAYLHKFLVGIAEVEAGSEDPETESSPVIGFQDIPQLKEMTDNQLRKELKDRGCLGYQRMLRHDMERELAKMDQAEIEPEYSAPETLAYHRLGDDGADEDWITRQPLWFQKLISSVLECRDIEGLKRIGKSVFSAGITGDRASVFWSFYNIRKRYLESRQVVRISATKFIERIRSARSSSELAGIGRSLYRLQRREVKGPEFREHEWKAIWAAYHEAKGRYLKEAA